jgi:hypothetical protein
VHLSDDLPEDINYDATVVYDRRPGIVDGQNTAARLVGLMRESNGKGQNRVRNSAHRELAPQDGRINAYPSAILHSAPQQETAAAAYAASTIDQNAASQATPSEAFRVLRERFEPLRTDFGSLLPSAEDEDGLRKKARALYATNPFGMAMHPLAETFVRKWPKGSSGTAPSVNSSMMSAMLWFERNRHLMEAARIIMRIMKTPRQRLCYILHLVMKMINASPRMHEISKQEAMQGLLHKLLVMLSCEVQGLDSRVSAANLMSTMPSVHSNPATGRRMVSSRIMTVLTENKYSKYNDALFVEGVDGNPVDLVRILSEPGASGRGLLSSIQRILSFALKERKVDGKCPATAETDRDSSDDDEGGEDSDSEDDGASKKRARRNGNGNGKGKRQKTAVKYSNGDLFCISVREQPSPFVGATAHKEPPSRTPAADAYHPAKDDSVGIDVPAFLSIVNRSAVPRINASAEIKAYDIVNSASARQFVSEHFVETHGRHPSSKTEALKFVVRHPLAPVTRSLPPIVIALHAIRCVLMGTGVEAPWDASVLSALPSVPESDTCLVSIILGDTVIGRIVKALLRHDDASHGTWRDTARHMVSKSSVFTLPVANTLHKDATVVSLDVNDARGGANVNPQFWGHANGTVGIVGELALDIGFVALSEYLVQVVPLVTTRTAGKPNFPCGDTMGLLRRVHPKLTKATKAPRPSKKSSSLHYGLQDLRMYAEAKDGVITIHVESVRANMDRRDWLEPVSKLIVEAVARERGFSADAARIKASAKAVAEQVRVVWTKYGALLTNRKWAKKRGRLQQQVKALQMTSPSLVPVLGMLADGVMPGNEDYATARSRLHSAAADGTRLRWGTTAVKKLATLDKWQQLCGGTSIFGIGAKWFPNNAHSADDFVDKLPEGSPLHGDTECVALDAFAAVPNVSIGAFHPLPSFWSGLYDRAAADVVYERQCTEHLGTQRIIAHVQAAVVNGVREHMLCVPAQRDALIEEVLAALRDTMRVAPPVPVASSPVRRGDSASFSEEVGIKAVPAEGTTATTSLVVGADRTWLVRTMKRVAEASRQTMLVMTPQTWTLPLDNAVQSHSALEVNIVQESFDTLYRNVQVPMFLSGSMGTLRMLQLVGSASDTKVYIKDGSAYALEKEGSRVGLLRGNGLMQFGLASRGGAKATHIGFPALDYTVGSDNRAYYFTSNPALNPNFRIDGYARTRKPNRHKSIPNERAAHSK